VLVPLREERGHGGHIGGGGSGHGHERENERKTTSGSKSTPSQGSRPRTEGASGDGSVVVERVDMGPGPSNEEVRGFYHTIFGK
jgi:hypothetical protein